MGVLGWLDREHSVARPGYSRWLVPPAALAIHLSIGQVYAFSVFVNPLHVLKASDGSSWNLKEIGYIFSIAIAVLGISAALFGKWIEKAGPRKALLIAALCFGSGFLVSAGGVHAHSLGLVYLGYGVIGGVGLGLGYIAPVATLIKWFPDRPGLATGLAIMGFGGGAMIGSPLATGLLGHYRAVGVGSPIAATLATMGLVYLVFMLFGVAMIRVPGVGWAPEGWLPRVASSGLISSHTVAAGSAMRTPQFWLIWLMLFLNTTAGIGILEQASPMIQNLFPGKVTALEAGGFVGVLSLFNMGGRFVWSSMSDLVGRKWTFLMFFVLGVGLYAVLPGLHSVGVFVLVAGVLISMYGGGFSTAPAYLKDLYGAADMSAIYGRLLTAWSTAGILGPLLVNGVLDRYAAAHRPLAEAYPSVLHGMAGLLGVGLMASLLVRPVAARYWIRDENPVLVSAGGH
jgi:MFS family permease